MELGLAAGLVAGAILFSIIGLLLELVADGGSKAQVRGQVWQQVSVVLAIAGIGWAAAARQKLPQPDILPGRGDRFLLWGLAGASLLFILVAFIRTAGYDLLDDFADNDDSEFGATFSSLDEQSWILFAFVWALAAFAWSVLTRQLEPRVSRRVALILTATAGFFCIGALAIGHSGDDAVDVLNGLVRASGFYGVALVLVTLAAAALFGRRGSDESP